MTAMNEGIEIRVLGELEIVRDGVTVDLPPSRKTRALLGYLALAERPVRRDRLCELLWDVPDDPRAALRWSLTKLRSLIDSDARKVVVADREHVAIDRHGTRIDWWDLFAPENKTLDGLDAETLEKLASRYRGPLLEGLEISGCPQFNAWLLAGREQARTRQIAILDHLVARLDGNPGRALPFGQARAELDPLDELAHARVVELLIETGNKRQAEHYGQAARLLLEAEQIEFTGVLDLAFRKKTANTPIEQIIPSENNTDAASIRQMIRFCSTRDNTRIAWSTAGEGPPLVKTANWLNHLEHDWETPVWSHVMRFMAQDHTLFRYDERGNGLSDWNVTKLDLETFIEDLEAVVEAAGLERFPLFAISQGCCVAAAYTARNPHKVSRLIMHGGYRQGWRKHGDPEEVETHGALLTLIKLGWGAETPAFRQLFSNLFYPSASAELRDAFSELQRKSCSPENACKLLDALGNLDCTSYLDQIQVPVLVTHCRGDLRIKIEKGRDLASRIPNARFVQLDSNNHLFTADEPAWSRFVQEVTDFLAEGGE